MIGRSAVLCLGLGQLICWGISYYLMGGFGPLIAADLGWSRETVYGGFSAALIVMGLTSPLVGRLIDRRGGRGVMVSGSLLIALGCTGLALSHGLAAYYASWGCLGVAMRMTLYDAAFATLARIAGPAARRPIAQLTLLGGLASTAFWPIGHLLAELGGWRFAVFVYAGIALATVPLHLAIPDGRYQVPPPTDPRAVARPRAVSRRDRLIAGALFGLMAMLTSFLNSGLSAHMIAMLTGLGLTASAAVWISSLRGIGQSAARLAEVLFGRRLDPVDLNLGTLAALPFSFAAGLATGTTLVAPIVFAGLYGAANGLATIARGTMPLVLFDPRTYGAFVGRLLAPSFLLAALAPLVYAAVIEHWGNRAALLLSGAIALVMLAAAIGLKLAFGRPLSTSPETAG